MNKITIRLPDETVNYLQRLDYELGGLQVLHTHALNAGVPPEKLAEICREHQEVFAEYQLAKNELWAEFAPRFPNVSRWWVDFQTGELHVVTGNPQSPPDGGGSPQVAARRPEQSLGRRPNDASHKGAKGPRATKAPLEKGGRCLPVAGAQRRPSRQARSICEANDGGFSNPGSEVVPHA